MTKKEGKAHKLSFGEERTEVSQKILEGRKSEGEDDDYTLSADCDFEGGIMTNDAGF